MSWLGGWPLACIAALTLASSGFAQQRISGRVIDPQGKPVAGIEVTFHAVTGTEGGDIDADTTDANGAFEVGTNENVADAVYFVAVVYNSELFMGDLMRTPFPANQEYIVQVGVNPVNVPPPPSAPELSPEEKQKDRTAGIAVVLATLAIIAALISILIGRRPPAQRRWLVELARLEDDMATDPDPDAAVQKRRAELRERLKAPKSG